MPETPETAPAIVLGVLDTVGPDAYAGGRAGIHAVVLDAPGGVVDSWMEPRDYALTLDLDGWRVIADGSVLGVLVDGRGCPVRRLPVDDERGHVELRGALGYVIRHRLVATDHDGEVDWWTLELA